MTGLDTLVIKLSNSLDAVLPKWRGNLEDLGQTRLIRARNAGWLPTDVEVAQGLFFAYLSAMTDWRRIQDAREEILGVFDTWAPTHIARLTDARLAKIETWFLRRKLGSVLLKTQLKSFRGAAHVFLRMSNVNGTVDAFFRAQSDDLAVVLGNSKSEWKLPGVGIALASEFLKNLGYDDFKPDRHLMRILGPKRLALCESSEPMAIRETGISLARRARIMAAELDQMLWLYCAKGYANICGAKPRCGSCSMRRECHVGRAWGGDRAK